MFDHLSNEKRQLASASLLVTIIDVQRAGMREPRYAVGARQLRDIACLTRSGFYRDEALPYEKNLIDDWMRRDFRPRPR